MPKETFFNLEEAKQEKVMRSTISEFLKQGFEKGNIGDIAKNAGVAKGSMYQYFENKKELFIYSVQWAMDLLMEKYSKYLVAPSKELDMFDYLLQTSRTIIIQMREEKELVIFIQDVFLGKHRGPMDESMEYMVKATEKHLMDFIRRGKENGQIRKDIDDKVLCLFVMAVSYKFKEYIMNRARSSGEDIMDEPFEAYEADIKSMLELLKHGMIEK
ncbi:MAG: TetR/AcrR family transcriptional regulator [Bacillota bacterium]|nr:TetR/AcrR family transcriptional regulator [Bacillota bacterium]